MRLPPTGLGGRLGLVVRAVVMLGIAAVGASAVKRAAGLDALLSPSILLLVSVPLVYGIGTVVSLVVGRSDRALARLERQARGLSVAWGFLVVAGLTFLQGYDSISLSRPGSVLTAAFFLLTLGGTGAFIGAGIVLGDERGELAFLLAVVCLWTPLFGAFAVALALGTPYYWLVATEPSLPKALGLVPLAAFGVGLAYVAVLPARKALQKWRTLGGVRG